MAVNDTVSLLPRESASDDMDSCRFCQISNNIYLERSREVSPQAPLYFVTVDQCSEESGRTRRARGSESREIVLTHPAAHLRSTDCVSNFASPFFFRVGNLSHSTSRCEFTYDSVGFLKWQMQRSMEQQWESQRSMGLANDGESDVIREMLSDTKPWLLVLTALVSVLHMVFEALAFRSNV